MSDYSKIKMTPEYRAIKTEVNELIEKALKPLQKKIGELEKRMESLEARLPKP